MKSKYLTLALIILAFIAGNIVGQNFNIQSYLFSIINQKTQQTLIPIQETPVQTTKQIFEPILKNIGDSFTLWDIEYKVLSAINQGSTYGFQKTSGKYIVIKIQATNTGKTEVGLDGIYLKDSLGRQYQKNDLLMDFSSGLNQYGITKDYKGIPPGFSETFIAVFEVPKDSNGFKLQYQSANGPDVVSVNLNL